MAKSFICIGDAHFPFVQKELLYGRNGIVALIRQIKPDYVIQMGDLYDMYSWSKFPFKRDVFTPEAELGVGRQMAEEMWSRIRKASPKSKCHQLIGNHDERPAKRLLERNPEFLTLYDGVRDKLFNFDGVTTQPNERQELVLDGIMFLHGYRSRLGDHARHNHMPTVCGHSHTGGVCYLRQGTRTIWELNSGYIADPTSTPMSYTRQRTISHWTHGVGLIDKWGPRFIPLDVEGSQ